MTPIRRHLTFANLVACTCLFVVLGGTAVAKDVARLVTGKQVKDRSLTAVDIRKGSLTGAEVKDGSLTAADIAGSIAGPKGDQGPAGPKGDAGPAGPAGPKGDTGTVDTSNFYSKTESDGRFLGIHAKADDADRLDGIDGGDLARVGDVLRAGIANGVGDGAGCSISELAVVIQNGRGDRVDHRFTFQVPGGSAAYGEIRSDGSIRAASGNVKEVAHTISSGVYCVRFNVGLGQNELESSVVSVHAFG